jgi:hypothetical protein
MMHIYCRWALPRPERSISMTNLNLSTLAAKVKANPDMFVSVLIQYLDDRSREKYITVNNDWIDALICEGRRAMILTK